MKRCKFQARRG